VKRRLEATSGLVAGTQVEAATVNQLYDFIVELGDEERLFFYDQLPKLINDWFNGIAGKGSHTDHLQMQFASTEIEARSYKKLDAIAIALGYLKPIYKPKLPATIYRSVLVSHSNLPKTKTINFKSDPKWGALQSWTINKKPIVADRNFDEKKQVELVLEIPATKANKHVVTDYVQLAKLANDAMKVADKFNKKMEKEGNDEADYWLENRRWLMLFHTLKDFKQEREVLLYVPTGTALKCTWRAYTLDSKGKPGTQIK